MQAGHLPPASSPIPSLRSMANCGTTVARALQTANPAVTDVAVDLVSKVVTARFCQPQTRHAGCPAGRRRDGGGV